MNPLLIAFAVFIVTFGAGVYSFYRLRSYNHLLDSIWQSIDVQLRFRIENAKKLAADSTFCAVQSDELARRANAIIKEGVCATTIEERSSEESAFSQSLTVFFRTADGLTDMRAYEEYRAHKKALYKNEQKLAVLTQEHNSALKVYNSILSTFPTSIVAQIFDFDKREPFNFTRTEIRK